MRSVRSALVAVPVVAATAAVALAATPAATKPTSSQAFFKDLILKDPATSHPIAGLLRSGAGFVDPTVTFADLTGDSKSDAIVSVDTGGASGAIAVYAMSTDGAKPDAKGNTSLRTIYRTQELYRATIKVADSNLLVRTPHYAVGDELCCPAKVRQRTVVWDAKQKKLIVRSTVEYAGPTAQTGQQPAQPQQP